MENPQSQKLLALAQEFYQMKPWTWMFESDIFGIEDSQTKLRGYASVMGSLGEHISITFYLGIEALNNFWKLSDDPENTPPETTLETAQLMLSFEDPELIEEKDDFLLSRLDTGINTEGRIPVFLRYSPGMFPIEPSEDETRIFTIFLEQAIEVIRRFEKNRELLFPDDPSDLLADVYLIREAKDTGDGHLVWSDQFRTLNFDTIPAPSCVPDPLLVSQLTYRVRSMRVYEATLMMFPAPIKEDDQPPYFPYLMLLVDKKKDLIVGYEMLQPTLGFHAMLESVPNKFLSIINQQSHLPKEIHCSSQRLYEMLVSACKQLPIKLVRKKVLRQSQNIIDNYLTNIGE